MFSMNTMMINILDTILTTVPTVIINNNDNRNKCYKATRIKRHLFSSWLKAYLPMG
jgi:hypothetical protein